MHAARLRERERAKQYRRSLCSCCCFLFVMGWAWLCLRVLRPPGAPPAAFFRDDDGGGGGAVATVAPGPLRRPRLRAAAPGSGGRRRRPASEPAGRLAFLFLVRSAIPTEPIWRAFFAGVDANAYSIYSHPRPGYAFPRRSLFFGTEIANRSAVSWGAITVARAEVALFRAALVDGRNERFLLASESCAPLHPFPCVFSFLFSTPRSFAKTWATADRAALYDFGADDARVKGRWRKGHQWVALARNAADAVASWDAYGAFAGAHARTAVAAEFRRKYLARTGATNGDDIHHNFADEHYAPTQLALAGLESDLVPASPTLIRFGAYAPPPARRLLGLNIDGRMKSDWRATTYAPEQLTEGMMTDARSTCAFADEPAPLGDEDAEIRIRDGGAVAPDAWRCAFSPAGPAPCHLLVRKIPEKSVAAYLARLGWDAP